jgi:ubiquinone/menaquinone biosynthesis C-methylase UbiE
MQYLCDRYPDYEQCFVPLLFGPWSEFFVLKIMGAGPRPKETSMLYVACGTGIVARTALSINPNLDVSGVDSDPDMLGIALSILPQSNWCLADGASLPFPDDHFDYALNQFGLMFFENRQASVREMVRMTKPGGKIGVAVWGGLSETHAYSNILKALNDYLSVESLEFL